MSLHDHEFSSAQARVVGQLCEALLFEGVATQVRTTDNGGITWQFGNAHYRAKGHIGAFGRFRLHRPRIERRDTSDGWQVPTAEHILDDLAGAGATCAALLRDLSHTVRLSDLNTRDLAAHSARHMMGVSALETALIEGHPYHPCFKARSGFTDDDHRRYGPEGGQTFRLVGVWVDKALAHETLPHPDFWRDELGITEWVRVTQAGAERGVGVGTHCLLPLHPWQWSSVEGHPLIQTWIQGGQLHPIGEIGDAYQATQSVRTLMNADAPEKAHVKTGLAMRNTSSMRILDPENVAVAPEISMWLGKVVAFDPLFDREYPLTILPEYASIIVGRDTPLAGHLAAIWRQSPASLGLPETQLMPLNAIAMVEPNGAPLIATWVEDYGVEAWVTELIKTVVLPIWHLMVAHGIGLEAHGQNLILHHVDGWPTGLVARDFHDSLEYTKSLLSRPDIVPDLAKIDPVFADAPLGKYHEMADAEALRELVMDTLFVFNLTDVSHLLQQHYGFDEARFWKAVRQHIDTYAQAHGQKDRQAAFAPFERHIYAESLITPKIDPGRDIYRHLVPNELAAGMATSKEF